MATDVLHDVTNIKDEIDHADLVESVNRKLQKTQKQMINIMQKVEDALALDKGSKQGQGIMENQLILDCNALLVEIGKEIGIIHDFIRDKYRFKFPELESIVNHPIDYARVVKKIRNEMDLTLVDLEGVLPSPISMVVTVAASITSGEPLPENALQETMDACDQILALDSAKKRVLDFVGTRNFGYNLSAIVGKAGNGAAAKKKTSFAVAADLYCATWSSRFGVGETEIFKTALALRSRACRLLALKATLAARIDSIKTGRAAGVTCLKQDIRKKINMWQRPPSAF